MANCGSISIARLIQRHSRCASACGKHLEPHAVRLQRLQRRRRRLGQWSVQLIHRGQRLTRPAAKSARNLAQRVAARLPFGLPASALRRSPRPSGSSSPRSHRTYWLPRLAIDPSSTAVLPVRWHTSNATDGVRARSAGCPISPSTCWMRSSLTRLRNGDCSSCTVKPCRSVSLKTGSFVLLAKSARTILSRSVSLTVA